MGRHMWIDGWPAIRQLTGGDPLGRGAAAESRRTRELQARTEAADRIVKSVCPYCAVGCGQQVYAAQRISAGQLTDRGPAVDPGAPAYAASLGYLYAMIA